MIFDFAFLSLPDAVRERTKASNTCLVSYGLKWLSLRSFEAREVFTVCESDSLALFSTQTFFVLLIVTCFCSALFFQMFNLLFEGELELS